MGHCSHTHFEPLNIANQTALFCLPASTGACRTAWNKILKEQLDARHRPCNFVSHLKKVAIDD
ncbi:hypothetical protein AYI85_14610 [Shewanella algae]|nr:hypothetical protein AYI85_14610 [Shewanella algae]TVL06069.1 hypothetical protein AYI84_03690 [Shewanella algae]TVL53966.1 hypothetical protein AYI99_05285 [Shewanella algae]TVO85070.1 hypothetical protein AYI80_17865 [Shewanella algae]TXS88112.1 hypothetical protein AYI81_03890 [Shewanella algae]